MNDNFQKNALDNTLFISAMQHEIFSRIAPTLRHDLVGHVSVSLMRINIINKILNKPELDTDKLKLEIHKIEQLLKTNILNIRELSFWDFGTEKENIPNEILIKSVQLMSIQLAMKNIKSNLIPMEFSEVEKIETKPLLYSLLSVFCYIEDNNFDNFTLNITQSNNSIIIKMSPNQSQIPTVILNTRMISFSNSMIMKFAELYDIHIKFYDQQICVSW